MGGKTRKNERDPYYRKAKEEGWRARSAYKLIHLDAEFGLLDGVRGVVDLCAAPGSWSQVLAGRVRENGKIRQREGGEMKEKGLGSLPESAEAEAPGNVGGAADPPIIAVDLQEMAPIPGVTQLQGDITKVSTAHAILDLLKGTPADIVVCDGAPDVTGLHDLDEYLQSQLMLAALHITVHVLAPGGKFVAKFFKGEAADLLTSQMRVFFNRVSLSKPMSSRPSSAECFIVCEGFSMPSATFRASMLTPFMDVSASLDEQQGHCKPVSRYDELIVRYVACGDLSGFDEITQHADAHAS